MIVFEDTRMLYFDYPNPAIVETNKRNTIVTNPVRTNESMYLKPALYHMGGPLRIFLSIFFKVIRILGPYQ